MKKFLFALLHATRIVRIVAWLNRNRVGILCYHGVTGGNHTLPEDPYKLHIPLSVFRRHLDYLQLNFHVVSLAEYLSARRERRKLPPYSMVLTFDDGFRNFATVAAPQLLQRRLPATAFLITDKSFAAESSNGFVGWRSEDDSSYLSWKEVAALASKGLEFGSHTGSHPRLLNLSLDDARTEFARSREAIVRQIGHTEIPLSYPHGKTSEPLGRLAASVGYSCGLTTSLGPNNGSTSLFALRRTVIACDDDLPTFAARASGLTWWTDELLRPLRAATARASRPGTFPTLAADELDI